MKIEDYEKKTIVGNLVELVSTSALLTMTKLASTDKELVQETILTLCDDMARMITIKTVFESFTNSAYAEILKEAVLVGEAAGKRILERTKK